MRAVRKSQSTKVAAAIWLTCRGVALSLLLPALMLWALPVRAAVEQNDGMPKGLRTGVLQRVFYDVDPRDAKAIMEVHNREISRIMGLNTPPKVTIFADMAVMADLVRRGELDIVVIPALEYLRIREKVPLIPSFVSAINNGQGASYVVIARKDSGIGSFAGLRGKSVLLPSAARDELGLLWLEVLLLKAGKGGRDHFFSQIKEATKRSHAITGVFFRQADAAVVTRSALDTSKQLNPQLDNQLTVLAESRYLSEAVVCLNPVMPARFRDSLARAIMQLNETTSGRQLFTVFQTSGIVPFKPAFLQGLENLLHEQNRLGNKR